MVENLKKIVLGIIKDEKALKEFEKLKTVKEVYEKCKELGYEGNYEEFEKDYYQIVYRLNQELSPEDLEAVSGGVMNKKLTKTMAAMLSALTLSSTAIPSSSAASFYEKHPNLGRGLAMAPIAGALIVTGIAIPKIISALNNESTNESTNNSSNATVNKVSNLTRKDYIERLGISIPISRDPVVISRQLNTLTDLQDYTTYNPDEGLFYYIYKIYNADGSLEIKSITDGIRLWIESEAMRNVDGNDRCIALADFLDFINTTDKIKNEDRRNRINQYLEMRMKRGYLEIPSSVNRNKTIIENGVDIDRFFGSDLDIDKNIFEIGVALGSEEDIPKEEILKDLKENIIIKEVGATGSAINAVKKYPISDIKNIFSLGVRDNNSRCVQDYYFAFFKSSPSSRITLDFSGEDWSREFKPRRDLESFFINKKSGIIIRKYGSSYTLLTTKYINEEMRFNNVATSKELREFSECLSAVTTSINNSKKDKSDLSSSLQNSSVNKNDSNEMENNVNKE